MVFDALAGGGRCLPPHSSVMLKTPAIELWSLIALFHWDKYLGLANLESGAPLLHDPIGLSFPTAAAFWISQASLAKRDPRASVFVLLRQGRFLTIHSGFRPRTNGICPRMAGHRPLRLALFRRYGGLILAALLALFCRGDTGCQVMNLLRLCYTSNFFSSCLTPFISLFSGVVL